VSAPRPPARPTPARDELAETTAVGEIYLRRLVRAQLGLSLTALLAFGGALGGLPLALWLLPGVERTVVLGVPIGLIVLCVPLFPLLFGVGWLYARRATALDDAFRALVDDDARTR
jgi:predicted Kef-type K+ transport protein